MAEVLTGELMPEQTPQPLPQLPHQIRRQRNKVLLEEITVDAIETFLRNVEKTGVVYHSADAAGLSYATIKRLRKDDEVFQALYEDALNHYKDSIEREIHSRAIDGWDEPVFSQRTGQKMGDIRRKDGKLLELLAKRHIPEYREKFEGTVTHTGGVLVAPIAPPSMEQWAEKFAGEKIKLLANESSGTTPPESSETP